MDHSSLAVWMATFYQALIGCLTGNCRTIPIFPCAAILRGHLCPAKPILPVHFYHGAGADQIDDKAHDFSKLSVHTYIVIYFLSNK